MDIEFLIERLERYILQESPKFFGNRLVNEDEARNQLSQLHEAVPEQVEQARELVEQRDAVLAQAKREAERIVASARAEAQQVIKDHQVVKDARRQAEILLHNAEREASRLQSDADEYVFNALSQLQGELTRILRVVENGLQKLETDRERALQEQNRANTKRPPQE
ncbi:MAG: hypothetical protein JXA33_21605 [Anaerolineae bacterium]|nr:hypothetical protein [Anaerolineae bacterium]